MAPKPNTPDSKALSRRPRPAARKTHDKEIRIVAQDRDYWQSLYRLDYVQTDAGFDLGPVALWSGGFGWLGMIWLSLFKRNGFCWDGKERSMLNQ